MASVDEAPADLLNNLSELIGAPAAAVRLLLSILLGFPLALIHRHTLYGKSPTHQHFYFVACGLLIGFWNYEWNILHSAYALLGTYAAFKVLGRTTTSVLTVFLFNMVYLLWGYYTTATKDYDIKWTMPQCVLTLRLIGLAFDLVDGKQPDDKLSSTQKTTALREDPSLLEMAAYVYFPGSFLIGPQFSMKRYLDYVNGKLMDHERDSEGNIKPPDSIIPGITRALVGFVYVALYQLGTQYVSDQYLLEPEFDDQSFVKRWLLLGLWGRCNLYKYISCWLITEGVCIVFGLTYNGKDKDGTVRWDGLANVNLLLFENATEFNHYILSFNINTNHWCAEYIYKRVKFLGSKLYSQIVTLVFLSIWHGLHSGYYLCFFQEFIVMYMEKDMKPVLLKNARLQKAVRSSFLARALIWILLKIYTFVFMGYSLIPFVLLSYSRYIKVYKSVYFIGHVTFLSYPLVAPFVKKALRPKREREHTE
ncbi:lysophospholipid acyltransferase 5 [Phymastichus coffea]|uniref:lysophospholipid acyltransferase 5 n=1 Tax=Phymastichus coffea TaxID=108790 RepID=UPI00273AB284|nr:lysophospholipid acyltransferase 5 [Phymastichus coffea]